MGKKKSKKKDEPIINRNRKDNTYTTIIITKNYKVLTYLKNNPSLINPEIEEDETLKIYQKKPYNMFIESKKKPYIVSSNSYLKGCRSGSPIYTITIDNSSVIASDNFSMG